MAKQHDCITPDLAEFIARQPMFFVATAAENGRINLSPKGLDGALRVLGPKRVAFLNLTGSGNETAAHLRHNPRITLMFCSFDAKPLILRLYGQGRALHRRDQEWAQATSLFPDYPGKRQVVMVDVTGVISSCGFGVPRLTVAGQRTELLKWAEAKGEDGIRDYWREKNLISFDGEDTGVLP